MDRSRTVGGRAVVQATRQIQQVSGLGLQGFKLILLDRLGLGGSLIDPEEF